MERVLTKNKGYDKFYGNFHSGDNHDWSNERWYPHSMGLLGEIAFKRLTGMDMDLSFRRAGDQGFDFPDETEIKTRVTKEWERGDPYLLVRKNDWERKKPSRYVLVELFDFTMGGSPYCIFRGQCSHKWLGENAKEMHYPGRINLGVKASMLPTQVKI